MNIFKFIFYRFISLIAQVIGAIAVIFAIVTSIPYNAEPKFRFENPNATDEELKRFRESLGIGQPAIKRFYEYLNGLFFHASLGTAPDGTEVRDMYFSHLKTTISTFGWGFLLYTIFAFTIAIIASSNIEGTFDKNSRFFTSLFYSFPPYVLGTLLIFLSTEYLNDTFSKDILDKVLPVLTVVLIYTGFQFRLIRIYMINALNKNYIRTAHSIGLSNRKILMRHGLKNALPEIITSIAITFPLAFSGVAVLEKVYDINGSGLLLINASLEFNWPVIIGGAVLYTIVNALFLAVIDIITHYSSPILRLSK